MEKEIILNTEPNLAEYRTNIEGWVGKNGKFYGKEKELAIYANSTHKKCDKGHIYRQAWTKCPDCREAELSSKYLQLKEKEWDKVTPLTIYDSDIYFWDIDEVVDYSEQEEVSLEDLDLVICKPNYLSNIEGYYTWEDVIPEDMEVKDVVDKEIVEKLKELNDLINAHKPVSWTGGRFRTTVTL